MSNGTFHRPADGRVVSYAGRRNFQGAFGNMHYGVDIGAFFGWNVRAAWNGQVVRIYGSGNDQRIVLQHQGFATSYLHLSRVLVRSGQRVRSGDIIGEVGTAGSGPHLHFEYHPGSWYNPSVERVNALIRGTRNDASSNPRGSRPSTSAPKPPGSNSSRPSSTPTPSTPAKGKTVATPRQNWAYGNKNIQKGRQAFNFLRFIPRDVWARKAARDFVNGDKNANGYGFMVSRIHEYTHGVWGRTWGRRQKPTQATIDRWDGIRKDGYLMHTWVRYTYSWARRAFDRATEARNESREVKAMLKAMAKSIDANTKLLEAMEAEEREAIQVNAREVAAELAIDVKDDEDEEN